MSNASATFGDAMNEKYIYIYKTTNKYLHVVIKREILLMEKLFKSNDIYIYFFE